MADATAAACDPDQPGDEGVLPADTLIAERYRILGLLGRGGMGAVYRAEHIHMRKTVALKVLHRELLDKEEVVARFEREAVAAGRIQHVNVAAASDFGKLDDGSYYLVLEYVDGQSLRALLDAGPITHARALGITRQIALALRSAHELGIVHRDLKPDNVMLLAEAGGKERVKVLDFGIARVTLPGARADATKLTRVGVIMGTVAYMSPEQALGQSVDGHADLYSLGVMLYEMIKGELPFQAELASQVLARQLTEAPPPLPAGTPQPLASLVLDLMEKSAAKRPATAAAVIARLDALNVSPSGEVRAPKLDRNRRLALTGAGTAMLAAAAWYAFSDDATPASSAGKERPRPATDASGTSRPAASQAVLLGAPTPALAASATPGARPIDSAKPETKSGTKKKGSSGADSSKRRTGPGGIYIPPPNQWFKN